MKKSIKSQGLKLKPVSLNCWLNSFSFGLLSLNCHQLLQSCETVNPLATTTTSLINDAQPALQSAAAPAPRNHATTKRKLNRAVAFELPILNLRAKTNAAVSAAPVQDWPTPTIAETGRPRRASSFSDLRELAESTQARPALRPNRSLKVMLVPDPIDLSSAISPIPEHCAIEIGTPVHTSAQASGLTDARPTSPALATFTPLARATASPVAALRSPSPRGHDPLVLALAASLKTYTEQNSEFLRNQAEQNRVATEERNDTRRGVRNAKILGAVAAIGTVVGPYLAPYVTAWVQSWK